MNPLFKYKKNLKVSKDQINKNPSEIGRAVMDVLSRKSYIQTVEETIEAMTPKYLEKLKEAAEMGFNAKNYPEEFYVLVERRKETLMGNVSNVLSHKYLTCPFKPRSKLLREERPNSDFDLYKVDKSKGEITHVWTLPCYQDSVSILKNKHIYDPKLVGWIEDYNKGDLDSLT